MSLTGGLFLTSIALLAIATFTALLFLWPRLAGRSVAMIAARAGSLLLVNLLVVLTAATQLNAQFLFFADWTDLQGALTGHVTKTSLTRGGSASHASRTAVKGYTAAPASTLPPLPAGTQDGKILSYTVKGPLSGLTGTIFVRLPPGYTQPADAATRYPVMETFQGYPGTPKQWFQDMDLGGGVTKQVDQGRMRQVLIVSPQVEIPAGVDTECVNGSPGYPQLETWLTQDVPTWVARTFRVRTDRASWAAVGFSAGGWCAAMAAMLHPAQYAAAIVMGGYFRPDFGPLYDPYPPNSAMASRYNLVALAKHHAPPVALWLETSHSDATSYSSSAALLRAARSPLAVTAVVLRHAGHRVSLWRKLLPGALGWLGANLSGFAPLH